MSDRKCTAVDKRPRCLVGQVMILLWLILLFSGIGHQLLAKDSESAGGKTVAEAGLESEPAAPPPQNIREIATREGDDGITVLDRLMSLLGLAVMLAIAFAMSGARRKIRWTLVAWGVGLQLLFALLILKTSPGQWIFQGLTDAVNILLGFTEEGARFVFGNLVLNNVPVGTPLGNTGMGPILPGATTAYANTGAFFAFNVLPTIIFFSSLMSILYHLGIMQLIVRTMAWVMQRSMKISGAESLSAAANIFVGQTEAPLVIKPYVDKMTNSELMAVMTGGFATIAGGVLAAYVGMLRHIFPDIAGHLIAASVMSAPAALVVAKIILPELEQSMTAGEVKMSVEKDSANVIDAAARGAGTGLKLALNVGAMLLAFIALIAMVNFLIGSMGGLVGIEDLTFQRILGWLFWPLAFVMGIPAGECAMAGQLLGEKMVLNEFVAYLHMADWLNSGATISYRTTVILAYALCGFANFGSIAIQLGGIGSIAPSRRSDLAKLGIKAMIAGTLAAFMTATIAGMIL